MKRYSIFTAFGILLAFMTGCADDPNYKMNRPDVHDHPAITEIGDFHSHKAPLYWSIYEACIDQQDKPFENACSPWTNGRK